MSDKPSYKDLEKRIEDLSRENRTLKRAEERIIALNQLAEDLLSPGNLNEKLKLITDRGIDIFDADFFRIWITKSGDLCDSTCIHSEVKEGPHVCQNRDRCLHLIASSGRYTHIDGTVHRRVPLGCYKIGRVASGNDSKFITNEVTHDPRVHDHEWAEKLGLVSFAGYRLVSKIGDRIGVMALFAKHPISPNEDAALEGLANLTSQIIQATIAEEELWESQDQFYLFMDRLPAIAFIKDHEGKTLFINRHFVEFLGGKDWVDKPLKGLFPPEIADKMAQDDQKTLLKGYISTVENVPDKDGILMTFNTHKFRINRKNKPPLLGGIALDITTQHRAEEVLRESEEKYRNIVIMNPDPIAIIQDNRFQLVSRAFTELFGYTQEDIEAGLEPISLVRDHEKEMVRKQIEDHVSGKEVASKSIVFHHATKNGRLIPCETSGEVIDYNGRPAILTAMRDISGRVKAEQDKNRLQAQLQQSQKMEAIGTLAGGIAHDFNNLLGVIVGNNELAMEDIPDWNPARDNLEEIHNACLRARDVVKQILAFGRQTSQNMKPTELGPLIKESLKLLRSSFPTTIEIRQENACLSDIINADPTQINQVLLNLCTNASHAMEDEGGILEVRLENIVLEEADAVQYADMRAGNYARLTISDTGHGIEEEVIDRIFEPYFTTKELYKGTGMGLAVAHGIVKNHSGHINVSSKLGEGTTFQVYFPVIKEKIEPDIIPSEKLPTGTEQILFVDDEQSIVKVCEKMLKRLRYRIETSTNPIEALEFFRAAPDRYDLVITDMTMPNMTGDKLAQELMKVRPDIPIILFTGHSERITEEKAKGLGIKAFVMKPIIQTELVNIIRQVLDKE